MKPARLLLIVLGVVLGLGALVAGLVLTPSVQRWFLLRTMRGQHGTTFDIESVSAGFARIELRGVKWEKDGLAVQLDRLEADYSPAAYFFSDKLVVSRLSASGLLVDATKVSQSRAGAAAVGAPIGAPGILGRVNLPFEIVLDDCTIDGRAMLPARPEQPPFAASYRITAGKFAPGQEGTLMLVADVQNPVAGDPVRGLHAEIVLRATQSENRTFSRAGVTAFVDAIGPKFSGQDRLKVKADLTRDAKSEIYGASVDTVLNGTPENLLAVHARLSAGQLSGDWTLKARATQLVPFVLGAALPEFDATGSGSFDFGAGSGDLAFKGSLDANVSRLEAVQPALRAIGPVHLQAHFDIAGSGGTALLNQLDVRVSGQKPVLEIQSARAAELNFAERRLQVGGSSTEAVTLTLHGLPLAWIRPFVRETDVSGGMITGKLAVSGDPDRLVLRVMEPLEISQLTLVREGSAILSKADISAELEAVLDPAQLAVEVRSVSLRTPAGDEFRARGNVTIPATPDPAVSLAGSYSADLPTLLAQWLPLGRIKAEGVADLTVSAQEVNVRRLETDVTDAEGSTLLKMTAIRPFDFDLGTRRAKADGAGSAELLRVALGQVPLAALPLLSPETRVAGMVAQGEFVLSMNDGQVVLQSSTPLRVTDLSVERKGSRLLSGLTVDAAPRFEFTERGEGAFQSGEIAIRNSAGEVAATLKAEGRQAGGRTTGSLTFALEVPMLARQPLFEGAEAVTAGRASGEIRVALDSARQVEARITLNGLVGSGGNTLPVANLSFRAVTKPEGGMSIQAPLLLDQAGRRSDLEFTCDLAPAGDGFLVDGTISGEHMEMEALNSLLAVFVAWLGTAEPGDVPIGAPVVKDTVPAWSGLAGRLVLDVKSASYGPSWSMSGLRGVVVIEPSRLSLENLDAGLGVNGRFAGRGEISFAAGEMPYRSAGEFSLTDFDVGALLRAMEPDRAPTIEGTFAVEGRFDGSGETVARTLELTRGKFELNGGQGVFRGLQRASTSVSMSSKAVELGASVLGSIFGSEKVTKAAEKVAGQAYFVDQLAQAIGEFEYDQLSVRITRGESLDLTLEDISLVSPEIRLLGRGTVSYRPGMSVLRQPLNASLALAARGKTEELLGKLNLVETVQDELGYSKTREPITLGGSLSRPDPTAFFTRIATAKLSDLLAPQN